MKKLFAVIVSLIICLSGCGWNVEIVDPTEKEQYLSGENLSDNPEDENLYPKDSLVEEIVLDFGAEKLEDGSFRSLKTGGFLYDNFFSDGAFLETKYYFNWARGEFVRRYSDWNTRFASLHGEDGGYSFPEEEFEEIIETFFGVSSASLRMSSYYCKEHGAYCSSGPGGTGMQYDIEIMQFIESEDGISIQLSVGGTPCFLNVLLLENGGYRFLSYLPEVPLADREPESLYFSFGGNPQELKEGDSCMNWVLDEIDILTDESDGEIRYVTAEFSAEFPIRLDGFIMKNGILEDTYDFVPRSEDEGLIPKICYTAFSEYSGGFIINNPEDFDIPEIGDFEKFPCRITIDSYSLSRGYTMTADGADVVSFIPLKNEAELTELQEEIILNFGAFKKDFGAIIANKVASLYFNTEGFSDGTKLGETSYFAWAMSYLNYSYVYEEYRETFSHPEGLPGWAYPSAYYESAVFQFFGVPSDVLRAGEIYDEEGDFYWIGGGGGIGDTPYIVVTAVEETEEEIVFHLTLKYDFSADEKMVLTVKLLPDGGYNYASYLPE
ncbi:MAG: hypothetical protein E7479_07985 [Ruminococcaceae bacterium]|nr:hypothetical protein [Oscillospiraceae bacterium]